MTRSPAALPPPVLHVEVVALVTVVATGEVTYHALGALDLTAADADPRRHRAALARGLRDLAAALDDERGTPS